MQSYVFHHSEVYDRFYYGGKSKIICTHNNTYECE